jgi:uncharacterized protein YdiU (UPF0061 family)
MNTDNFSILGLTLDYGPYGFLDAFDPGFICNHTDTGGRYAFNNQPGIGLWNCSALAAALTSLVPENVLEAALATYQPAYRTAYLARMRAKLGLTVERDDDADLIFDLLRLLDATRADYTRFFRALCDVDVETGSDAEAATLVGASDNWHAWRARFLARLRHEPLSGAQRRDAKRAVNPKYILRNHLAQIAIERAQRGDFSEVTRLHALLCRPYDDQPENESYAAAPPDWASTIEISCSS